MNIIESIQPKNMTTAKLVGFLSGAGAVIFGLYAFLVAPWWGTYDDVEKFKIVVRDSEGNVMKDAAGKVVRVSGENADKIANDALDRGGVIGLAVPVALLLIAVGVWALVTIEEKKKRFYAVFALLLGVGILSPIVYVTVKDASFPWDSFWRGAGASLIAIAAFVLQCDWYDQFRAKKARRGAAKRVPAKKAAGAKAPAAVTY